MKRNISDMMNEISADEVKLKEKTPLSECRIRQRTMAQIGCVKSRPVRWLPRAAVVAAVIMVMTISVFAADVVWNEGTLFSTFFGRTLYADEMELMDDIGRTIGEAVTQNGATVTAVQAVADESAYWLRLRVEAPEGVVLPDIREDETYFYYLTGKNLSDVRVQRRWSAEGEWETLSTTHTIKPLPDSAPEDNVKEFNVIFYALDGDSFNRGGQLRLVMPGLYIHKGQDRYLQTLFTGRFIFDISVDLEMLEQRKLVVDTGNVTFYNEEYDYTTTVSKVTISPLHIDISCSYTEPNCQYIFPYGGPVQIVMKDGTVIDGMDAYFDAREQTVVDPNDVAGSRWTCLDEPIVVENIDYIILGEEHIFDVN